MAIAVLLLLQTPPVAVSVTVVDEPRQIAAVDVIADNVIAGEHMLIGID